MNSTGVFREITNALNQARIAYMLTGSFASNLYGTGRATQDIDFVISATPDQLAAFLNFLPKTSYYFDMDTAAEALRRKSMFNILDMTHGWKIDFIFMKSTAYHQQAFLRRRVAEIEGISVVVITAEDLIIAKLDWAKMGESFRQITDVAGILKVQAGALDNPYLEKWTQELGLVSQWNDARRQAEIQ